jgi:hypothetical protein
MIRKKRKKKKKEFAVKVKSWASCDEEKHQQSASHNQSVARTALK